MFYNVLRLAIYTKFSTYSSKTFKIILACLSVIIVLCFLLYVSKENDEIKIVQVSNAEELINAIASNCIIEIQPGEYNLSTVAQKKLKNVTWEIALKLKNKIQYQIVIRNISNLTLRRSGKGLVHIYVNERYADVLSFFKTKNLGIDGLKIGHFPDPGHCLGAVLNINDSQNISIDNSILYGCGTEGLTLFKVKDFNFNKSIIEDCSYGIMTAESCDNLNFKHSIFRNNKEYYGFNFKNCLKINFRNCTVKDNILCEYALDEQRLLFDHSNGHQDPITFSGGVIENNKTYNLCKSSQYVVFKDTKFIANYWASIIDKKKYESKEWKVKQKKWKVQKKRIEKLLGISLAKRK